MPGTYKRIYAVVSRIPRGKVATYGQVGRLAGLQNQARLVGYALHALAQDSVPWQRVINARGEVSRRGRNGPDEAQRALLEGEGVRFDLRGRVNLSRYGWKGRPRGAMSRSSVGPRAKRR